MGKTAKRETRVATATSNASKEIQKQGFLKASIQKAAYVQELKWLEKAGKSSIQVSTSISPTKSIN